MSEADRQTVNQWIRAAGHFDAVIDFDAWCAIRSILISCCRFMIAAIICILLRRVSRRWATLFRLISLHVEGSL